MLEQYRKDIFTASIQGREQEVMTYQINIDNYTLALQHISAMPQEEQTELTGFADQLRNLLASEKLEQKKAKVMLSVLKQQLE